MRLDGLSSSGLVSGNTFGSMQKVQIQIRCIGSKTSPEPSEPKTLNSIGREGCFTEFSAGMKSHPLLPGFPALKHVGEPTVT